MDIIKDLLIEKAKSCQHFKVCLIENKEKILAESTHNKSWGTGLSKWLTECTKPSFWPGNNILGIMLMEITNHILAHPEEFLEDTIMDTDNPSNPSSQQDETDCTDNSDEDYEECEGEANRTSFEVHSNKHDIQEE